MISVQILPASTLSMVKTMLFFILQIPARHAALGFSKFRTIPSLHTQIKPMKILKVKMWTVNFVRFPKYMPQIHFRSLFLILIALQKESRH